MTHKVIVAKVESITEIPGANSIQVAHVLGENVIVGKNVNVGDVGLLFPADLQISEKYAHINNLNRDPELNSDKEKKGFFDKNRKVRAQPFMKIKSTAYFADINSVSYTGVDLSTLVVGTQFNELNGEEIAKRFVSEEAKRKAANVANNKSRKVNEVPLFFKHKDSEQLKHYIDTLPVGALLSFHAKAHGTSFRVGKLPVMQALPAWKKFVNKVIPLFPESKMEMVVGTRNVVLQNPDKEGFHGSESFRFDVANVLQPFLTDGMTVFGEIVGYVNGKPIMSSHNIKELKDKNFSKKYGDNIIYSYNCKPTEFKFFVYRITVVGMDGETYEFPQKQLEEWCSQRGIDHTLEVHPQVVYDGDVENLKNIVESLTERPEVLTEDYRDPSHISEGIILRVDYMGRTTFYKNKSYAFKVMEGICSAPDIEELS